MDFIITYYLKYGFNLQKHHHKYAHQLESPPETQYIFDIKPHQRKMANAAQGSLLLAI